MEPGAETFIIFLDVSRYKAVFMYVYKSWSNTELKRCVHKFRRQVRWFENVYRVNFDVGTLRYVDVVVVDTVLIIIPMAWFLLSFLGFLDSYLWK